MKHYELKEHGYEKFGEADTGGGYDWNVFGVWLKDGVFYWADDAGCSCSNPWDYTSFPDGFRGRGSAHEAIKSLHSWVSDTYSVSNLETLLTKLLDYKPSKEAA